MKKIFVSALTLCCIGFLACSEDNADKTPNQIFTAVFDAVDCALYEATNTIYSSGSSGSRRNVLPSEPSYEEYSGTINYISPDSTVNVTGSWELSEEIYNFDLTLTFANYTTEDGIVITGSAHDIFRMRWEPFYMSDDLTGNFTVIYEGKTYNFSWDIDFTMTDDGYTLNGGFWLDGKYYPAEFVD